MNNDLISRSALKKAIKSYADDQYAENEYLGECSIMNIIDNAPTVVPEDFMHPYEEGYERARKDFERPQGKWIDVKDIPYLANCSHCGYQMDTHEERGYFNYCPYCGADLRGEEE